MASRVSKARSRRPERKETAQDDDARAKAQYRRRLDRLAEPVEEAESLRQAERAGRLADERAVLIRELAAANGSRGRGRRLGGETERARQNVGARIRDSPRRIDAVHPDLAAHLRAAIRLGITCSHRPVPPTAWRLGSAQARR